MQSTASIVSLVTQRQMPNIEKIPKTVGIVHVAGTLPVIQEIQKIVDLPLILSTGEVVGMPVVMKCKCVRRRRARTPGSCHRSRTSSRSLVSKTTRGAATGPAHWKEHGHRSCETTLNISQPPSPGDGRGAPKSAARSSGRRGCWDAATDHRRSDVPMNTRSRSGR